MLILDLQVLTHEAWRCLHDLNDLVLEDQQLSSYEIYFEEHLIGNGVDISVIDPGHAVEEARRERQVHLGGVLLSTR